MKNVIIISAFLILLLIIVWLWGNNKYLNEENSTSITTKNLNNVSVRLSELIEKNHFVNKFPEFKIKGSLFSLSGENILLFKIIATDKSGNPSNFYYSLNGNFLQRDQVIKLDDLPIEIKNSINKVYITVSKIALVTYADQRQFYLIHGIDRKSEVTIAVNTDGKVVFEQ